MGRTLASTSLPAAARQRKTDATEGHGETGMTSLVRCLAAVGLALALLPARGVAQGVAPLRLGAGRFDAAPTTLFRSRLGVLVPHAMMRIAATLPTCTMPVATPDLARSERMPGSHAPSATSIGPERFGCTNPLGPQPGSAGAGVPVHP